MGRRHDEALFARGPLRKASSILKVALPPFSFLRCSGLRITRFREFLQRDFETKVQIFPLISVRWFLLSGAVSFAPVLFFRRRQRTKKSAGHPIRDRTAAAPERRRNLRRAALGQRPGPNLRCKAAPLPRFSLSLRFFADRRLKVWVRKRGARQLPLRTSGGSFREDDT